MLLLLHCELLDALLQLRLGTFKLIQFILHIVEPLRARQSINLLLKGHNLLLDRLDLFVHTAQFVLLQFQNVAWIVLSRLDVTD